MPPNVILGADDYFNSLIEDLVRRLDALEVNPILNIAAISKGVLEALDENNNPRVQMGLLPDGLGFYGIRLLSASGVELFRTDDRGIVAPGECLQSQPAVPMNANGEEIDVTSAGMTNTFAALWSPAVAAQGLIVTVPWITDAATSGAIQVTSTGGGNTPTATQALPAGSSGDHVAYWLHGIPLGTQSVVFTVQAQRTAGSGNVRIFYPTIQFISPVGCSASGGWT